MEIAISKLVERLCELSGDKYIIDWASPVPAFGDPSNAQVATLGLNPSDREFVDARSRGELDGPRRRFPTLRSLGLGGWHEATDAHMADISDACRSYFERNPYRAWFDRLDLLIRDTGTSFYPQIGGATHLDLVPFATQWKWSRLRNRDKTRLSEGTGEVLGMILRESPVILIVLNGQCVVKTFQNLCDVELRPEEKPEWSLQCGKIRGKSFTGVVDTISGVDLGRRVKVLGFNHNIQGSFGVTSSVRDAIQEWIRRVWKAWN